MLAPLVINLPTTLTIHSFFFSELVVLLICLGMTEIFKPSLIVGTNYQSLLNAKFIGRSPLLFMISNYRYF